MKSILFLLVLPGAMFVSCGAKSRAYIVLPENADYRSGDLVLRCGYGAESRAVSYGGQSVYSHVGMLVFDDRLNHWMVVHAVPGETRADEPEYIKYEAIENFFASDRACKGAWMRVLCADSSAAHAAAYCLNKYNDSVLFDNSYLLGDTTELYCCELVWRAYLGQGIDITSGNRHAIPTLFCAEAEGIFPSDIEKSDKTVFVKPFNFVQL
ncbi:MAG: hypothetical protein K5660_06240 [Paludibacteraceae bacterium]|nr:hypothetical protein [Paludibacteraceae bacterium]